MAQPELTAEYGAVVTIGIKSAGDRAAIVLPMGTIEGSLDDATLCKSAADAVKTTLFPLLKACISVDAEINFVQAEAMMNGKVPYRMGFSGGTHAGTRTGSPMPSNVAALALFYSYQEQDDPPDQRTRVGKTFIAGVSVGDVEGDQITTTLQGKVEEFAQALLDGIADSETPANTWYRALAVPRPRPTVGTDALGRIAAILVPGRVATQRRRLLPSYT